MGEALPWLLRECAGLVLIGVIRRCLGRCPAPTLEYPYMSWCIRRFAATIILDIDGRILPRRPLIPAGMPQLPTSRLIAHPHDPLLPFSKPHTSRQRIRIHHRTNPVRSHSLLLEHRLYHAGSGLLTNLTEPPFVLLGS
jgi:hypothetical protein